MLQDTNNCPHFSYSFLASRMHCVDDDDIEQRIASKTCFYWEYSGDEDTLKYITSKICTILLFKINIIEYFLNIFDPYSVQNAFKRILNFHKYVFSFKFFTTSRLAKMKKTENLSFAK